MRRILQPPRSLDGTFLVRLADDDEPPSLPELDESIRVANTVLRSDDYSGAARLLPIVITQARVAAAQLDGDGQRTAWRHLCAAYQLAAAEAIDPDFSRSPARQFGTWGWLHLGAAASAARNNRTLVTRDSLRAAAAAGTRMTEIVPPEYWHTSSFSPDVVTMRKVECAVVLGDHGTAIKLASQVPPPSRSLTTYHRFRLDVAAALAEQRKRSEAVRVLTGLRVAAPNWFRRQRYAKTITRSLIHTTKRTVAPELRDLADFLCVSDTDSRR